MEPRLWVRILYFDIKSASGEEGNNDPLHNSLSQVPAKIAIEYTVQFFFLLEILFAGKNLCQDLNGAC